MSITDKTAVTGAHGITVLADLAADQITRPCDEMLILPGGMPGTVNLENDEKVNSFIDYAYTAGKYVCAICAAPSILGKKMILDGKRATCFPGFEKYLYGALLSNEKVVRDGKIITAKGAGASAEFGFSIVEKLKDHETACKLKEIMQY